MYIYIYIYTRGSGALRAPPGRTALSCGNRFLPRGKGARRPGTLNPFGSLGSRLKGAARPDDTTCCEVLVCISVLVNCGSLLVLQLVPKAKKPLKRPPGTEHWPKLRPLLEYLETPKVSFGSSGSPIGPQGRPRGVCDTARGPLRRLKLVKTAWTAYLLIAIS